MKPVEPFAKQIIQSIKNDTRSGATELTRDVLGLILCYADCLHAPAGEAKISLVHLVNSISLLRPSMAPLQNITKACLTQINALDIGSSHTFIHQVKALCRQLIDEIDNRQQKQINHAINAFASAQVILTLSRSSVVCEVFKALPQRPLRLIVCESRPGCEGRTLAAELASSAILIDYIVDAASGLYLSQADMVVVGADAILTDGSVVNKCGTSLLALAAQHFEVPFYVVADSTKCTVISKAEVMLEEMPLAEIHAPTSPFIHAHNVYFDVSPAESITAYITENGIESQWPWAKITSASIC